MSNEVLASVLSHANHGLLRFALLMNVELVVAIIPPGAISRVKKDAEKEEETGSPRVSPFNP